MTRRVWGSLQRRDGEQGCRVGGGYFYARQFVLLLEVVLHFRGVKGALGSRPRPCGKAFLSAEIFRRRERFSNSQEPS